MSKEELYEQFILAESKKDFIATLIPDSESALYFTVLNELNNQSTLSEETLKALGKLQDSKSTNKHQGYGLHSLDFLRILRTLDSAASSQAQRDKALEDLKHYFGQIKFNAAKPYVVPQVKASLENGSALDKQNQAESVLDNKILNVQNYLNLAYTNLHNLQALAPQCLYSLDPARLLKEAAQSKDYHKMLETFLSNVPCLHQVKDVPLIYKALYENYKSRKQIYDFSQAGYDRLTLEQLSQLGTVMKAEVFETAEFQLALIKKQFYKDLSQFKSKSLTQLSKEEKINKKKEYSRVYEWTKTNLPKKLNSLSGLLRQELALLNLDLEVYDQESFIDYIQNPPFVGSSFTTARRELFQKENISGTQNWSSVFEFESVNSNKQTQIIEQYLFQFFKKADTIKPFDSALGENFLNKTFLKAKILSGQQQYIASAGAVLPKYELDQLIDSRSITIADSNERYVKGQGEVKLVVETKNIQNLVLNVFEVKTENYFLSKLAAFDNQINLDGLIPIHSSEFTYKEPSNQAVRREFSLTPIQNAKRGVFVAEFFGNSISSRAVFKKGLLTIIETPTIAGHLLCIVDEEQNICKPTADVKTGIWLSGRFHSANEDGQIIIPYQKTYQNLQVIAVHGEFAELSNLTLKTEEYNFACTYMYNQESFLQGSKAKIIIHVSLDLNGVAANMALIEDQVVKVSTRNHQDIPTTLEFRDIKFHPQNDIEIEIPIQSIVKSLEIECTGVIKKMDGSNQTLFNSNQLTFDLHQRPENQIFGLYLQSNQTLGYVVLALDKTGQPIQGVPVEFEFRHKKINDTFRSTLQTNEKGKITLGLLENVTNITANMKEFNNYPIINENWNIQKSCKTELPDQISILEDELVEVPLPENISLSRENFTFYSLNQVNGQDFVYEDLFNTLKKEGSFIQINNLKEGTYVLNQLEDLNYITIKVYKGKYWGKNSSYLVANNTFIPVEREKGKLVTIKEALLVPQNEKEADVIVNLNLPKSLNASERKKLRVHIFAYNFFSNEQENLVQLLRRNRTSLGLQQVDLNSFPASFYNNKKIGDEVCYVYQRKNEQKRIGNTLEKPQVLLKRTFNRDTNFEKENLAAGENYASSSLSSKPQLKTMSHQLASRCCMMAPESMAFGGAHYAKGNIDSFLNFLACPCFVSANSSVNEEGQVLIPGLEWNNYASIQVVVTSDNLAISDSFSTNQLSTVTQDLRHQSSMKPNELYTENLSSGQLLSGKELVISADSQTAVVGSIPELFEIQKVLMKTGKRTDEYLGKGYGTWAFLKEWVTFTDRQKLEKYNEFASHELNLFLFFKDTAFFNIAVAPFIKNKLQKQFLDFFLLGNTKEVLGYANTERVSELNILEQVLLILTLVQNGQKQRATSLASSLENVLKTQPKNTELQKRLFLTIIESSAKDEVKVAREECLKRASAVQSLCGARMPMAEKKMKMFARAQEECSVNCMNLMDMSEKCCEMVSNEQCFEVDQEQLMLQRKEIKEGYKKLEKTVEYVERNYFGDNKTDNYSKLISVNPFWVDLAKHILASGSMANFVTQNFIFAFNNHVEALAVISLMDLSFSARDNYDISSQPGRKIQIAAKKNVLYFSKEILKSNEISKANVSIIQTFFDPYDKLTTLKDDPTVQIEKDVDEFLINKIYGTKVIITNTSIANLNLQVLSEIPSGSIPVNSFEYTKSIDVLVNSYQTINTIEFYFYFPKPGSYTVYRSNASRNGKVVAQSAEIPPIVVKLAPEIRKMENLSDILNNGSKEDILNFARTQNLSDESAFKISQIYYILQSDKDFFVSFLDILRDQGLFVSRVWEHSLLHNYEKGILELLNNSEFRQRNLTQNYQKIYSFQGTGLSVDNFLPLEYHPLLTSRAHSFMNQNKSKILNVQFKQSYADYLAYLAHVPQPTGRHYLLLCYYLLLQERIEDALNVYTRISKVALEGEAQIQRDYLSAYLDIYTGGPNFKLAREISERYVEYPIISWRNLFVNLSNQLAEYDGQSPDESEQIDNTDLSTNLKNAEKEQSVSIEIKEKQLVVLYQNVDSAEINFYKLDLEVLFSTQPFLQGGDRSEFTFVKPNESIKLTLQKSSSLEKQVIDIPSALAKKNLYIQLVSASGVQSLSYFSSSLKTQILDKFGQVKITDESNSPLQKVYVKCFAKYKDDSVAFFRDGYTDLRGRFDYALSSANDITQVKQFAIFICSEDHGAIIRECPPPSAQSRMETTITLLSKKK